VREVGASIQVENLSVVYGQTTAVDRVSFEIFPGEKVSVTGANGAGKSSVLRALLGLQSATTGTLRVNGKVAEHSNEWNRRRREIAYIPQRPPSGRFPLAVRELLQSSGAMSVSERAEQLGVASLLQQSVATLSGGQMQRCYIARALMQIDEGANVLLADEPTSALDFEGQVTVAEILASTAATLIVVTHEREMASRCDRAYEMAGGHIRLARMSDGGGLV
jgi:ABC-type Mn2+/Zn2+ transport system ATPase subunit